MCSKWSSVGRLAYPSSMVVWLKVPLNALNRNSHTQMFTSSSRCTNMTSDASWDLWSIISCNRFHSFMFCLTRLALLWMEERTGDVMCRRIDKIRKFTPTEDWRFIINSLRFAFKQHFASADRMARATRMIFLRLFFFGFSPRSLDV